MIKTFLMLLTLIFVVNISSSKAIFIKSVEDEERQTITITFVKTKFPDFDGELKNDGSYRHIELDDAKKVITAAAVSCFKKDINTIKFNFEDVYTEDHLNHLKELLDELKRVENPDALNKFLNIGVNFSSVYMPLRQDTDDEEIKESINNLITGFREDQERKRQKWEMLK